MAIFDFNIGADGDIDLNEPFVDLFTGKGTSRYIYNILMTDRNEIDVDPDFGVGVKKVVGSIYKTELRDEIREKIERALSNFPISNLKNFKVSVRLFGDGSNPHFVITIYAITGEVYTYVVYSDGSKVEVITDNIEAPVTVSDEEIGINYDVLDDDDIFNRLR